MCQAEHFLLVPDIHMAQSRDHNLYLPVIRAQLRV